MARRLLGRMAIATALVLLVFGIWGCSGDDSGDTSGVPRGELPAGGEAVMYEFYTDT